MCDALLADAKSGMRVPTMVGTIPGYFLFEFHQMNYSSSRVRYQGISKPQAGPGYYLTCCSTRLVLEHPLNAHNDTQFTIERFSLLREV